MLVGNLSKPVPGTDQPKLSKILGFWKTQVIGLEKCMPYNQVHKYPVKLVLLT